MKKKLSNEELVFFCQQLALLLKSGISLLEGVSILRDDAATEEARNILSLVYDELLESGSIRDALQKARVFPPYLIHMAQMGDISGSLDDTFQSLALYYQREEDLSKSIRDALSYPLIMLGMLSAVLLVLILKVMPIFQQVFTELGAEMNGFSRGILSLGNNLRSYSFVFLILLLILAGLILWVTQTKGGKTVFLTVIRKLPLIKTISEKAACSRFAAGMSMVLHSGLDMEEGFDQVTQLVDHPEFQIKVQKARELIHNGEDFSDALNKAGIFSGMDARMVSIAFRTGDSDSVLAQIAQRHQEEIETRLQNTVGLLEPALVAVLSVLVGLILLSVMLPLVSIMSSIG